MCSSPGTRCVGGRKWETRIACLPNGVRCPSETGQRPRRETEKDEDEDAPSRLAPHSRLALPVRNSPLAIANGKPLPSLVAGSSFALTALNLKRVFDVERLRRGHACDSLNERGHHAGVACRAPIKAEPVIYLMRRDARRMKQKWSDDRGRRERRRRGGLETASNCYSSFF